MVVMPINNPTYANIRGNIKSIYAKRYNCAKTALYSTNMMQSTVSEQANTCRSQLKLASKQHRSNS